MIEKLKNFYLSKSNLNELRVLDFYKDIIIEMKRYTEFNKSNFIIVYISSYYSFHYPFNDYQIKKDIKNFFSKTIKFIDLEIEIKNKFELD